MTAARTYLAGIKERAENATSGPWEINRYDHGGGRAYILNPNRVLVADFYGEGNREFLYAARTDLPRVADALLAVLALHEPCQMFEYDDVNGNFILDEDGNQKVMDTICRECTPEEVIEDAEDWSYDDSRAINYPCPTVKAITTALEGIK